MIQHTKQWDGNYMNKTILLGVLILAFCILLASCGETCEHAYDNACDLTCNGCGATREGSSHDYAPADCENARTCEKCGSTVGNALGHTQASDDGNCTTDIKCVTCGKTVIAGLTEHKDTNHDFLCDNQGCQIILDGAPEDEHSGIDFPLVPAQ